MTKGYHSHPMKGASGFILHTQKYRPPIVGLHQRKHTNEKIHLINVLGATDFRQRQRDEQHEEAAYLFVSISSAVG